MNINAKIRIAVTGSRGKSSVVRLLHSAFAACGLKCRSRITGVIPRELYAGDEYPILRATGANVAELKWWLCQLPTDTEVIISENSAISPELQSVCPDIMAPTITVITNTNPDHTAQWGNDEESVLSSLSGALPNGGTIILPDTLANRWDMRLLARKKKLNLAPVKEMREFKSHLSINDIKSTKDYFHTLKWLPADTTLIYNHRHDRWDRLKAFDDWISQNGWKRIHIIGDIPFLPHLFKYYTKIKSLESMANLITSAGRCFGCGNTVYGLPLAFKLALEDGTLKI